MNKEEKLAFVRSRIDYWLDERQNLILQYGQFARVVERASSMVGTLKLLRDAIHENNENLLDIVKNPESLLLPCYWDRCKEISNIINEIS